MNSVAHAGTVTRLQGQPGWQGQSLHLGQHCSSPGAEAGLPEAQQHPVHPLHHQAVPREGPCAHELQSVPPHLCHPPAGVNRCAWALRRLLESIPTTHFHSPGSFTCAFQPICFNFSRAGLPGQQSWFRSNLLLHLFLFFHELQMQK